MDPTYDPNGVGMEVAQLIAASPEWGAIVYELGT